MSTLQLATIAKLPAVSGNATKPENHTITDRNLKWKKLNEKAQNLQKIFRKKS